MTASERGEMQPCARGRGEETMKGREVGRDKQKRDINVAKRCRERAAAAVMHGGGFM